MKEEMTEVTQVTEEQKTEEPMELTYRQEGDYLIPNLLIGGLTEEEAEEKDRKLRKKIR